MRFFKYLILIILSLFSVNAIASYKAWNGGFYTTPAGAFTATGSTPEEACHKMFDMVGTWWVKGGAYGGTCRDSGGDIRGYYEEEQDKCPPAGYPSYYYFTSGGKVPTTTCTKMPGGQYCVYKAGANPIILNHENDRQSVTLYSVSDKPVSSCTPLFDNECDKKDPYGKCYQPPNDGCTRQADGSIICPENAKPPTPEEQCGGADYCNRPPNGCPEGYVSGSFNGQALCVKSSPSTGGPSTGDGDGSGSGGDGDGSGSGGDGDGSGSGGDGSGSGGDGDGSGSGGDGDGSGSGGDGSGTGSGTGKDYTGLLNSIIASVNDVAKRVSQVSTDIKNENKSLKDHLSTLFDKQKTSDSENTGKIVDAINDSKDTLKGSIEGIGDKLTKIFSDEGKDQLEQLGQPSNDQRVSDASSGAQNALQNLANKLTFSSTGCVSDMTVTNIPMYGSMTVPLSKYCDLLALIKIFLQIATLMGCLRMIDATVRNF